MALILDKEHTSTIIVETTTGGTIVTGTTITNINITDVFGNIYDNPYLVVDNFIVDKIKHFIHITVDIYKDNHARINNYDPMIKEVKFITNDEELYNKYFSIENMDGGNIFKAIYDFISIEFYVSWKSDE